MNVPRVHPATPDPLFPGSATLPLSEPGGVQYPLDNRPGSLRPFVATLAVAAPPTAKHHTASTRNSTSEKTYNQPDGEGGKTDTITDTTTDT
ncbi:MAG: hypothetical protein ACRDTC_07045 [Pseudonocardiaceae bacterium]